MARTEQLDLEVPAVILDLGRAISDTSGRRISSRPPGSRLPVEQLDALAEQAAKSVLGSAAARKALGMGQNQEAIPRLRVIAYVGWQQLSGSSSSVTFSEAAQAAMSGKECPTRGLLQARHLVGRLLVEQVLVTPSEHVGMLWNGPVLLHPRLLGYLSGGHASLGLMSPQRLASARLKGTGGKTDGESDDPVPAPLSAKAIRDRIAARVVGLEEGGQLDLVSGRLAMHMVRAKMLAAGEDPGTPNEIVLVLGESGTGKTWLCEQAGIATGLPQASCNASELSASGYVGLSAEDGLRGVLWAARGRVEAARFGLMTYDEITKRARSLNDSPVNSTAVFNELLRIVQGQLTQVGGKRGGSYEPSFWIQTYGMFFFLCGHAPGLERLIVRRMGRKAIGFGAGSGRRGDRALLLDALEDYGIIPEMLNRLTAIVVVPPPTVESLCKAATSEHGVIASYGRLLGDAMFFFEDGAVLAMARHCLATKAYYRGLAAITSALAADAVARDRKGAVVVAAADVRRAIGRMDDGVAGLLGKPRRSGPSADPMPDEGSTGANSETGFAGA